MTLSILAASFLSFGFVWVIPLLFVLQGKRGIALVAGVLLAFYGLLYASFGFDYLAALHTAFVLENPQGYALVADPARFVLTRLQDIGEILIFLGPFLIESVFRGMRVLPPTARRLFLVALGSFGALLVTGAYRTGETARACLFLFPFLLLPALTTNRRILACLVFGQALLMQLFGRYFW